MIYAPKRFVFIHIPRTAGNSITSAICCACAGKGIDVIVGTAPPIKFHKKIHRHIPAFGLKRFIPEWDDIYKFAVYRPEEDRIRSAIGLVRNDLENKVHEESTCSESWKELLLSEDPEKKISNMTSGRPCSYYTTGEDGSNMGVDVWDFRFINEDWEEICTRCKIPYNPLPRLCSTSSTKEC